MKSFVARRLLMLVGFMLIGAWIFATVKFRLSPQVVLLSTPIVVLPLVVDMVQTWALANRRLSLARRLTFDPMIRAWLDIQIATQQGRVEDALRMFDALPATAVGDGFGWNLFVNALISAGRYHEAVRMRRRFGKRLRVVREKHVAAYGLVLLNVAEALYNLGHWRRAKQLMLALESRGFLENPLNRAGGRAQLAWIAAHDGDPASALSRLASVDSRRLPSDYRAELYFTFVAAQLANGDLVSARRSLDNARYPLIRVSSRRNILFMEARCARAEGNLKEAARLCELASNHEYRGQGGDGLLLWGDVCSELGDLPGAQRAWQLAIDRDPESESARFAKQRLNPALEKSA